MTPVEDRLMRLAMDAREREERRIRALALAGYIAAAALLVTWLLGWLQ